MPPASLPQVSSIDGLTPFQHAVRTASIAAEAAKLARAVERANDTGMADLNPDTTNVEDQHHTDIVDQNMTAATAANP